MDPIPVLQPFHLIPCAKIKRPKTGHEDHGQGEKKAEFEVTVIEKKSSVIHRVF
jgi:hypothetical protein